MKKFTFRKEPPETGLRGVGNPHPSTTVKLDGKEVGKISAPNWQTRDGKWGVGLIVEDAAEYCGWKWVFFKKRHDTEQEARDWLAKHRLKIAETYTLHPLDD